MYHTTWGKRGEKDRASGCCWLSDYLVNRSRSYCLSTRHQIHYYKQSPSYKTHTQAQINARFCTSSFLCPHTRSAIRAKVDRCLSVQERHAGSIINMYAWEWERRCTHGQFCYCYVMLHKTQKKSRGKFAGRVRISKIARRRVGWRHAPNCTYVAICRTFKAFRYVPPMLKSHHFENGPHSNLTIDQSLLNYQNKSSSV